MKSYAEKYIVTKPFGSYKVDKIVSSKDRYIRRKVDEGGCLKPLTEKKMDKKVYENKMMKKEAK